MLSQHWAVAPTPRPGARVGRQKRTLRFSRYCNSAPSLHVDCRESITATC